MNLLILISSLGQHGYTCKEKRLECWKLEIYNEDNNYIGYINLSDKRFYENKLVDEADAEIYKAIIKENIKDAKAGK